MKTIVFFPYLMPFIMLLPGCRTELECCFTAFNSNISFSVTDSTGADLLDPAGEGALEWTDIRIFYLKKGKVVYEGRNAYGVQSPDPYQPTFRLDVKLYEEDYPGSVTVIHWGQTADGRLIKPDTIGVAWDTKKYNAWYDKVFVNHKLIYDTWAKEEPLLLPLVK